MLGLIFACATIAADPPPSTTDRQSYEAARSKAGRDADAHVKLALWCEQHGLSGERAEHLALAAALDPANALARGLMGLVADGGKWRRPEAITRRAQDDADAVAKRAEYARRRSRAENTADAQWNLALWCEEHGLKAEATAHLTAVTRLGPSRDAAWKRLGYRKVGHRWRTDAQLAAEKADAEAQKQADIQWGRKLERLRSDLRDARKKAAAEAALADVTDPRALPSALKAFGTKEPRDQKILVQLLGQIDSPRASRTLAMLAVFGDYDATRRVASETLRQRDPREFADIMIALLKPVIKYEVKRVGGPGSPGELTIHTKDADIRRLYRPPALPEAQAGDQFAGYDENGLPVASRVLGPLFQTPGYRYGEVLGFGTNLQTTTFSAATAKQLQALGHSPGMTAAGRLAADELSHLRFTDPTWQATLCSDPTSSNPFLDLISGETTVHSTTTFQFTLGAKAKIPIGQMQVEAMKSAVVAANQLDGDVAALEAYNAPLVQRNATVSGLLTTITGQDFGDDHDAWRAWLIDQVGFNILAQQASGSRTTITEDVPLDYTPQQVPVTTYIGPIAYQRFSCFGAGTPVQTLNGPRPIEALRVGDRVLSQDPATGALAYQPVLVVHHNPPSPTFRIDLGGEPVVASPFHRFWLAGRGWKMARDLKPGDVLRTLEGPARVVAVSPERVQKVYNLDVAESRTFFAGRSAALVHDNSVPDFRAAPFDAPAPLARSVDAGK